MGFVLTTRVHFEDEAQAIDAWEQVRARAQNTRINTQLESTSYSELTDEADGSVLRSWELDTFGILRTEPVPAPPRQYPLWIPVTGSTDVYPAEDVFGEVTRVEHNGQNWENTHGDGNQWEPGVFGWTDLGPAE